MKHTLADYTEQAQKAASGSNALWRNVNVYIAQTLKKSSDINEAIKRLVDECPKHHPNEPVSISNIRAAIRCMKQDIDLTLL